MIRFLQRTFGIVALTMAFALSATASVEVNGFLLPTWLGASSGVDSFSQNNLSAFTAAGHPTLHATLNAGQTSMQLAQSRLGVLFKPDENLSTAFEFDFIDFSKSSPTTAALPRVRRAVLEYSASKETHLFFGQDWDIVSPLNPYTYNPVGNYFEAGNIGFMRIQLGARVESGSLEHTFALGLPGNNSSSANGVLETGVVPSLALRESMKVADDLKVGLSGIGVFLAEQITSSDRYFSGALNGFAEWGTASGTLLKAEAYVGQNTVNLGMLGLAFAGSTSHSVKEAGAWVTLHQSMEGWGWFAGLGGAQILNTADMMASYSGTAGAYSRTSNGPGIESNATARIGAEVTLTKHSDIFFEFAQLWTKYHLLATDANVDSNRQSSIFQAGMKVRI